MPDRLPAGPYRVVALDDGTTVPWYIVPFDKAGRGEAPRTRDHLLQAVRAGGYTDVFLFCHGWNNDWEAASGRYAHFLDGYVDLRRDHGLTYSRTFRPLLIGVIWPSTALVMPWEEGPQFAAGGVQADAEIGQERREIQEIAALLAPGDVDRFYALAQRGADLDRADARQLARMLLPLYDSATDQELPSATGSLSPAELVDLWQAAATSARTPSTSGEFGFAADDEDATGGVGATPQAAGGFLDMLDPRNIVRSATVLLMKDRAGAVGAHGVGELLREVLDAGPSARMHLIGHSYGCKVVLSAVSYRAPPRTVDSILLLQPAVSCLCFAEDATGDGRPGGYRVAMDHVVQPILTTFSKNDVPLTKLFHLAVRRRDDLGEIRIAGLPPSRYAALGGFGPAGCDADCRVIRLRRYPERYDLAAGPGAPRIVALNGDSDIKGHGDISNAATWWALYNQASQ
jgi:hypothetical protein